ncbi:hypothetical protein [Paracoccus aestuariivivens]|uniref:hypothetical protein n=1 Tax=Paracoccus aestuariivivens TaxID=1820333 RepID=UPI0014787D5A
MDITVETGSALPTRSRQDAAVRRHAFTPWRSSVSIRAGMLPWIPFWMSLGIGGWFLLRFEPGFRTYAGGLLLIVATLVAIRIVSGLANAGRIEWTRADRLRICLLAVASVAFGMEMIGLRSHLVSAPVLGFRYYGAVEGGWLELIARHVIESG